MPPSASPSGSPAARLRPSSKSVQLFTTSVKDQYGASPLLGASPRLLDDADYPPPLALSPDLMRVAAKTSPTL